jgi:type IV pili sensor histidine kinase/response regulator
MAERIIMHPAPFSSARTPAALAGLAALLLVLGGCASTQHRAPDPQAAIGAPVTSDLYDSPSKAPTANVVRTGRYQLVPLAPTSGQRDLLQQAVSIDIPHSMRLTVRDGLEHALRDSGLRLCSPQAQSGFFSQTLPAVHRELGPTTLSDALQVLAGPAWRLRVDFADRTVCFERRAQPANTVAHTRYPASKTPQTDPSH